MDGYNKTISGSPAKIGWGGGQVVEFVSFFVFEFLVVVRCNAQTIFPPHCDVTRNTVLKTERTVIDQRR